jgi:hypothetical protein
MIHETHREGKGSEGGRRACKRTSGSLHGTKGVRKKERKKERKEGRKEEVEAGDTAAFSFRFTPSLFLFGPSRKGVVGFLSGLFATVVHYLVVFLFGRKGLGLGPGRRFFPGEGFFYAGRVLTAGPRTGTADPVAGRPGDLGPGLVLRGGWSPRQFPLALVLLINSPVPGSLGVWVSYIS